MTSKYAPVEAVVFNVAGVPYSNATEAETAAFRAAVENLAFGGNDLFGFTVAERQAIAKFIIENRAGVTRVMNDDYSVVRLKTLPEKPLPAPPVAHVTNTPRAGETAAQTAARTTVRETPAGAKIAMTTADSALEKGLDDALASLRTAAQ